MEVPRLGVKLELQLLVCATATATQDPSHVCNLHHSSRQCRILNPLSEARDPTHILMDASRVHNLLSYNGNSLNKYFLTEWRVNGWTNEVECTSGIIYIFYSKYIAHVSATLPCPTLFPWQTSLSNCADLPSCFISGRYHPVICVASEINLMS